MTKFTKLTAFGRERFPAFTYVVECVYIMRFTPIIILLACMQVSAKPVFGQTVSLSCDHMPLVQAFSSIEKQSGFRFIWLDEQMKDSRPVTLHVSNEPLSSVLEELFRDQPLGYRVDQGERMIILEKKIGTVENAVLPNPQPETTEITGRILNEDGQPLEGASVVIKGSKRGVYTNVNGEFVLRGAPVNAVLFVSFVGFEGMEVKVSGQKEVMLKLRRSSSELDQTVIKGYYNTTDRLNTGDVSTVAAKDIEEQPVSNPLATLEGRVPGLFITQSTGVPGGAFTAQILGKNSIANGNDPFFVIDGVPYPSQNVESSINSDLHGGSPLDFLNPSDIESITILKDADATSIYGSQAANGAILITTKKGKTGAATININIYSGVGHVTRMMDLLNTPQYLQMRNEAFNNDVASPNPNSDFDLTFWDTTRYTNWQKSLIGNASHYSDAQVSISGGGLNVQYLISGGFHRETTVFPGSKPDTKGSVHANITGNSENKRFKFSLLASYVVDKSTVDDNDQTNTALLLSPDAPKLYNPNGSLNWAPLTPGQSGTWSNPLAQIADIYNGNSTNLVSSGVISYTVLKNLELKANLGFNNLETNEEILYPTTDADPGYNVTSGSSSFSTMSVQSWIIEPQVNYKITLYKGVLSALCGSTFQQTISKGIQTDATGFTSDALLGNSEAASSLTVESYDNNLYKYDAVFGRLNYNWEDKYLLNYTIRRDGSSRFGPGKQFATFSAIGGAWIFTKERFFQNNLPFLSFGKLKASYGTTGNDQIGDYKFYDLYKTLSLPYQGTQGLYPGNLYNPDLAWEINKKIEGGLSLGFERDKIIISANYFLDRSGNQLLSAPLSRVTGFSFISENLPALVQNSGWEITLNTININTRKFVWSSYLNLTIPKNKLVSYPNLANSNYGNILAIGQPLTIQKVFKYLGVNDSTGVYEFASGTDKYNPAFVTDQNYIVNLSPKYYGGFQNSIKYINFQLDIFFQFVKQMGTNIYQYMRMPGMMYNEPSAILDRWQKPGDLKPFQQFSQSYSSNADNEYYYFIQSSGAYSDASYIRLKNLSFSYSLGQVAKSKIGIQGLRIYLQCQNLLTFTKYIGMDPENQGPTLPPLRVISAGIQASL